MFDKSPLAQGNAFMVKNDWPIPPGFSIKCNSDSMPFDYDKPKIDLFAGDVLVGRWQGDDIQIWASDLAAKDMVRTIFISLAERANAAWTELKERRDRDAMLTRIERENEANAAVKAAMAYRKEPVK